MTTGGGECPPALTPPALPKFNIDRLRELSKFNPNDCNDNDDVDDALDDDDDNDDGGGKSPGNTKLVRPGEGFYYQNDADNALLNDIFDKDYQEKHFLSIPNEPHYERPCNCILGSPLVNPNATRNKKRRYAAEQKQFTGKTRRQLYKQMNTTDTPVSPLVKGHDEIYILVMKGRKSI